MITNKRKLQVYTSTGLTVLLILMGSAWIFHALSVYRITLERQIAEDNEIVKANLGIIIDQITKQYVEKSQAIGQIQNILEGLQAQGWNGYACVLDERGQVLAHPNKKMVGRRPPVESYEPQNLLGQMPPAVLDLPQTDRQTSAIYRTQAEIIAIGWLPQLMTYLCIHKPMHTIEAQIIDIRNRLMAVGIVIIALAGSGCWFFTGNLVDRYEHHLAKSEHRNRTLVQSSAPIVITDLNGTIRYINPSATDFFGFTLNRSNHVPFGDHWPEKHKQAYQKLLALPPDQTTEFHDIDLLTQQDRSRPVDIRACRIEYDGADAIYFIIHDITENRRAREEILEANERLRELDQLKNDFINTVSHELRTPLTSIRWSTESLSQLINQEDEKVSKLLRIIRDDNHRLSHMIEELLSFARLDAGRLELQKSSIDLHQVAADAIAELAPLAQQKNINLQFPEPTFPITTLADRNQIKRVLLNLLDNAIKYTSDSGVITLALSTCEDAVEIRISDTGIGILDKDLHDIFDKFYRTSQPEVQKERGTGLGLAIVKGIVDAHQGHISVQSRVGHGTEFSIVLPKAS